MRLLRVLLVDDQPQFLDQLIKFLTLEPGLEIVGQAFSGVDALEQVERLRPDLVLMDVRMPELDGLQATRSIKARPGGPCVVLMSLSQGTAFLAAAQSAGADGFVSKREITSDLLPLVRTLFPDLEWSDSGSQVQFTKM